MSGVFRRTGIPVTRCVAFAWVAVAALAGACASGGSQGSGELREIRITIMNNAINASQTTFVLSPTVGERQTLGMVDAGRTDAFTASMQVGRSYRLIAQSTAGDREIPFQLFGTTMCVSWNMSTNRITQSASCAPPPQTRTR